MGLAASLRDAMAEDYDPTELDDDGGHRADRRHRRVAYSQDYGDDGAAAWVYCPTDAPQGVNSRATAGAGCRRSTST